MERIAIKTNSLNRKIFDNAVLYMNVCKGDTFNKLDFKDEFDKIKILFFELSTISIKNITEYFIKRCNDLNLKYDYHTYMYIMYLIKKYNSSDYHFSECYKKNVDDLYYLNDIEAKFNEDRFRLHYRTTITDTININNDLDESIIDYIKNNIPKDVNDELEFAIAIYVLVCKLLQYDGAYLISNDLKDTVSFEKITFDNPKGVCVQVAIIYYKLLKMYGIDTSLIGSIHKHLSVNLRIGTMMLNADATKVGYYSETYNLSDLTNVKLGFIPEGFILLSQHYIDHNYVKYHTVRLYDAIRNVYKKMGLSLIKSEQFEYLIDKMQKSEFGFDKKVNKEDIDRRISMINSFPLIEYSNVENNQYLSRIITSIFGDIFDNRVENLMIYKVDDGKVIINSLLIVYDEESIPYYYLLVDGKFINYNVNDLCDYMINNNWLFKNGSDVDALDLTDDNVVYKLVG